MKDRIIDYLIEFGIGPDLAQFVCEYKGTPPVCIDTQTRFRFALRWEEEFHCYTSKGLITLMPSVRD